MTQLLRNYWYIACASSRLDKKPLASRVLDQDLVVFRDATGQVQALLDRCCHRGTRLSLGRLNAGSLACGYHGWRYDGTGRCVHIPSLAADRAIPAGIAVPSFACQEQDGYVWVWMGDRDTDNPPPPLPGIPDFDRHRWHQGSILMQCAAMKIIENNLDVCHVPFTHRWTHPYAYVNRLRGFIEGSYELRLTERGMVLFAPPTAQADDPIPERPEAMLGFELPDRMRVELWNPFHMIAVMHAIPTGPNSCRFEWLGTKILPFGRRASWRRSGQILFHQDQRVVESAQPWYDRAEEQFERSVEADASTLLARRIVELAAGHGWEQARTGLPQRRVVAVRA